jgi:hypothetical protein
LHAPSRTTLVVPSFALEPVNVPDTALRTYSPEVLRPSDAPSPRSPLPGLQVPTGSHPAFSWRPRRGISTPASVRLRRFPRPGRFAPPRTLWPVSATHAPGVGVPAPHCMPVRQRPCDRASRTWGVDCSCKRLPDGPAFRRAFHATLARTTAPAAEATVPVPAPRASKPTHLRSPARRSGRSSRDRAASGCPAAAPAAANRRGGWVRRTCRGCLSRTTSTRPRCVTTAGGRAHRDRVREGPARAYATQASRPDVPHTTSGFVDRGSL